MKLSQVVSRIQKSFLLKPAMRSALYFSVLSLLVLINFSIVNATNYALVIGIGKSPFLSNISKLDGPENDARAMEDLLLGLFGYQRQNVIALIEEEATKQQILNSFDEIISRMKANDFLFFYYSGHGAGSYVASYRDVGIPRESGAILPYDFERSYNPSVTRSRLIVSRTDIRPRLSTIEKKGGYALTVYDACYSRFLSRSTEEDNQFKHGKTKSYSLQDEEAGEFEEDTMQDIYPFQRIATMTASQHNQEAKDIPLALIERGDATTIDGKPHGVMTNAILDGLLNGIADTDKQNGISIEELFKFLKQPHYNLEISEQKPCLYPLSKNDSLNIRDRILCENPKKKIGIRTKENRIALLIGNRDYKIKPLINSINDARDMAQALSSVGFDVIIHENSDEKTMRRAIIAFGNRLEKGGVGLFYYAGHGFQVNGRNYLVPLKTNYTQGKNVIHEYIDVNQILDEMGKAKNRLNIMILDACRDNPLVDKFDSSPKGLAKPVYPSNTIVAFATKPNEIAGDGKGRNSTYTKYLLMYMWKTGLSVEDFFKLVRNSVKEATDSKQEPMEWTLLTESFYFVPKTLQQQEDSFSLKISDLNWKKFKNQFSEKNYVWNSFYSKLKRNILIEEKYFKLQRSSSTDVSKEIYDFVGEEIKELSNLLFDENAMKIIEYEIKERSEGIGFSIKLTYKIDANNKYEVTLHLDQKKLNHPTEMGLQLGITPIDPPTRLLIPEAAVKNIMIKGTCFKLSGKPILYLKEGGLHVGYSENDRIWFAFFGPGSEELPPFSKIIVHSSDLKKYPENENRYYDLTPCR